MEASTQLRYWSICLYVGRPVVTTTDCLMDENVVRDSAGYYTIVISSEKDRPSNARSECGITWLPLKAGGEGITWRMMSTSAKVWEHAPQQIQWKKGDYASETYNPNAIKDAMGDYAPVGRYMTRADAEVMACRK